MQAKPEMRKSDRFDRAYMIKFGDDLALSPYYAVSTNLSEKGMYFKSLFELYPGARVLIRIDDDKLSRNKIPAQVVWCRKLEDSVTFRYGVGVEFLRVEMNFSLNSARPIPPRAKRPKKNESEAVIEL